MVAVYNIKPIRNSTYWITANSAVKNFIFRCVVVVD